MKTFKSKFRTLYGKTLKQLSKDLKVSYVTVSTWHQLGILQRAMDQDLIDVLFKLLQRRGRKVKRKISLSIEDLLTIWNRDQADKMKSPRLTRINKSKKYSLDNCEFVERTNGVRHDWNKYLQNIA